MTDEYKAFLESRKTRESDRPEEVPRWRPKTQEKPQTGLDDRGESGSFLAHQGIPGMKWGRRRFQNKDGSLTPEGRKRYGVGEGRKNSGNGDSDSGTDKAKQSSDSESKPKYNSRTSVYRKDPQSLTDDELNRRVNRMMKEAQYNQLRSQIQPESKSEKRKKAMRTLLSSAANKAADALLTSAFKKSTNWIIKKASGGKIDLLSGEKGNKKNNNNSNNSNNSHN